MPDDPWTWLLGRTRSGLWRHVPYQAAELGQGQDPAQEPRVEVLRRLIAYPPQAFAAVIGAVSRLEEDHLPVRWLCYREPGTSPARPYWLAFVSARPGGRRFHFGLELFDRDRLGLWFFSGYDASSVPPELLAPFPSRPDVSLPRVELTDATLTQRPVAHWIASAWRGDLRFQPGAGAVTPSAGSSVDQSVLLDASIQLLLEEINPPPHLSVRAARARLVVQGNDGSGSQRIKLFPLARLSTLIGRDPRCNIVLDDPTISSEHCRILWRDGEPLVEDLGSKNGTWVAKKSLSPNDPRPLPPEVQVQLGSLKALYIQDLPAEEDARSRLHRARVDALVSSGQLTPEQAEKLFADAEESGVTPGELLLKQGRVPFESWGQVKSGGCALLLALLPLLSLLLLLGPGR